MPNLPNTGFLNEYLAGTPTDKIKLAGSVILPLEVGLIEERMSGIDERKAGIAQERAAIAEQSGDNWHDGAFRESDREVLQVEAEYNKLSDRLHSIIVDYPEDGDEQVTLGSRVTINNGGTESKLDIVGFASIHDKKANGVMPASLEAPIIQSILGKYAGEMAVLKIGGSTRDVAIVEIDQQALRLRDENARANQ